jgi:hypothetical protein
MTDPNTEELRAVVAFLLGEAALDGCWYGEGPPPGKPQFWWRSQLRAALDRLAAQAGRGDGEDVSQERRLAAHTVYGSESAMDELEAIIRQAERYNKLKLHGEVVEGCVLVHHNTIAAAEGVYADNEKLRAELAQLNKDFDRLADEFNRQNGPSFMGEPALRAVDASPTSEAVSKVVCKPCNGTGAIFAGEDVQCIRCDGTGWVVPADVAAFDAATNPKRAVAVDASARGGEAVARVNGAIKTMNATFVHMLTETTEQLPNGTLLYASPAAQAGSVVSEAAVERALHARVPGGAEVWWWLPQEPVNEAEIAKGPHETARVIIRAALQAAQEPSP